MLTRFGVVRSRRRFSQWKRGVRFAPFVVLLMVGQPAGSNAQQTEYNRTKTALPLYTQPAKQAFLFVRKPETVIDTLRQGVRVRIIDEKHVNTFFQQSKWLRVEVLSDSGKVVKTGWLYGGKTGEASTVTIPGKE